MVNRWALLIGVDFYYPGQKRPVSFRRLQGCVRDTYRVKKYLQALKVPDDQIFVLTSSYNGNDERPMESGERLPNINNIVSALKSIGEKATGGDLVHIHYSGHGISRREDKSTGEYALGGDSINGTALALVDVMSGGAYLTAFHLGEHIRYLVEEKKLRVSLVLDSCHSGSGLRHSIQTAPGFTPRTADDFVVDTTMLPSDVNADKDAKGLMGIVDSDLRNAVVKRSWLLDATGCTVISACERYQSAGERNFGTSGDPQWSGLLTYWLLEMIHPSSQPRITDPPTYEVAIQNIKSKLTGPNGKAIQTPVLHGDIMFQFFGDREIVRRPAHLVTVTNGPEGHILDVVIHIGFAQGVAPGAVYMIGEDFSGPEDQTAPQPVGERWRAHVEEVSKYECKARLVSDAPSDKLRQTCQWAVLETWALPPSCTVYVPDAIFNQWDKQWEAKLKIPWVPSRHDGTDSTFMVAVKDREFQITGSNCQRLNRVPDIPVEDGAGIPKAAHVLAHLARWTSLKDRAYGIHGSLSDPHLKSLNLRFEPIDNESHEPLRQDRTGTYLAKENQEITLQMANGSQDDMKIHVAVFIFNASWGIHKLAPDYGQPMREVPKGDPTELVYLRTKIPNGTDLDPPGCTDLYRAYIFVGDNPPSWDELELQDLPLHAKDIVTGFPYEFDENKTRRRDSDKISNPKDQKWGVLDFRVYTCKQADGI